ncbi:hypothetical protein [Streptomyces sp. TP-A0356]|uniref:hypothetical protein n=1 Tax=Streptomyces sp. TP-A0356 TaxID=1359208 RepID=UPI001F166D24|nr:hypothetical protein [Streptomyces sp. TP-A0356]
MYSTSVTSLDIAAFGGAIAAEADRTHAVDALAQPHDQAEARCTTCAGTRDG